MARILEHGKYRTATCSCGCKFTFEPYEVDTHKQIKCPECKELVTVQVKEQ